MFRYEVMEIKHGRAAMLGFLHVILIEAGVRFPTEQCEAAPAGLIETRNMFRYGARRRRLPQSRPAQPGRSPRACAPALPARSPPELP